MIFAVIATSNSKDAKTTTTAPTHIIVATAAIPSGILVVATVTHTSSAIIRTPTAPTATVATNTTRTST
eukprot:9183284-Pyramimonas_sp.AAC.1